MVCCALMKWLRRNSKKKDDDEDNMGYVPVQGLGESIQLLLAYGNKNNEEESMKIKPIQSTAESSSVMFANGQPLLEVHKKQFVQSTAISRYLGKRLGISGADPFEDLEIDQIVEVFNDFRLQLVAVQCEPDCEARQKKLEEFKTEAPKYLHKFDAVIATNNGHLALGKLTWADFVVAGLWDVLKSVLKTDLDHRYPHIGAMVQAIHSIPSVKATRTGPSRADT